MIRVMNGKNFTDEQLKQIELVKPDKVGNRWQGVAHYDLVKTMESRMDAAGWKFDNRTVSVDATGFDMVGAWDLTIPGIAEMPDQKLAIGFQHSNRCRRSLRLLVGSTVFVCTNGLVTGEIVMKKKHTINLSLETEIDEALGKYIVAAQKVKEQTDQMKFIGLSDEQADHILMEAGRRKLVGFPTLGKVSQEYLHPTFADNGTKTVWGLYNAFTFVAQKMCVNHQLNALHGFQQLIQTKMQIAQ